MNKTYKLYNAITLNATGEKYNALAIPVALPEIKKHAAFFEFDFCQLKQLGYIVYKLCKEDDEKVWQGAVAFKTTPGALECANMEASILNKQTPLVYGGVGKCLVALCCKFSFDNNMDGFIYFDAKNRLMPYYRRMGAYNIGGLRMVIDEQQARRLIEKYF